jgi:hypothetical protein
MFRQRIPILISLLLVTVTSAAQTFDLDQFDQLFRPRLRLEARWLPAVGVKEGEGSFEDRSAVAVFTFPLHSRFEVGAQIDLTADGWEEMLRNSVRLRASQIMGNLRYGTRQVFFDEESHTAAEGGPRMLHTASIGALGVSLTKKFRVLFWSANVNVSEEDRTFDRAVPRFSGVLGKVHVKGKRRNFFYGLAASYTDRVTLPIPLFGGTAPIGERWSFQYVLPAQVAFGYRANEKTRFLGGLGFDGYRSGIEVADNRYNMSYGALRMFVNVRHRLSAHFALRGEVGYALRHRAAFGDKDLDDLMPSMKLEPGVTCMIGVNVLFGESILERIMDEVFK